MRLHLKVPPVAVWAVFALAIAHAPKAVPGPDWPEGLRQALAATFVGVGLALGIAGVLAFQSARTTVDPTQPHRASAVVTQGIFRWTRNPMYLGLAVGLLGIAAWWPSLAAPFLIIAFVAYITVFQIRPEEQALERLFGDEYERYRRSTRRWL